MPTVQVLPAPPPPVVAGESHVGGAVDGGVRIAFAPVGTQGDHQPFVPLVHALMAKGFTVQMWVGGEPNREFMER